MNNEAKNPDHRIMRLGSVKVSWKDRGESLVETMLAVFIALIGVFSMGGVIFQATATNKNQGTEATRATIYAQDKIEKLLSIGAPGSVNTTIPNYLTCTQSSSSQPAICNSTGVTGSGWTTGLLAGGEIAPRQDTCPASGASVGYVDYLDANGLQYTGSCGSIASAIVAYVRQWQVQDITPPSGGPTIKQVTVAVYSQTAVNTPNGKPVVVLTSLLANPN